jgi:flagellin
MLNNKIKGFIMGFRINTNVSALNSHNNGIMNNRNLSGSLEKLSSGLRINKAADDASGMAIADSLRSQSSSLGQAIRNANDAIGIVQTADKAMDEQVKILDTIKVKATQAAQDGQTEKTRKALQADITRLMEELDNIAQTTTFNGQSLLSGSYSNKEFQIGAYSNQTIKTSIGATSSDKIGHTRFETGATITASGEVTMKFTDVDGLKDVTLESVKISTSAGTGLGALAEVINKNADAIGATATFSVQTTGSQTVASGTVQGLTINGVTIGTVNDVKKNDSDGKLVAAINDLTDKHGVEASIDERGRLQLTSTDGRGIRVSATGATAGATAGVGGVLGLGGTGVSGEKSENFGRLTLTRLSAKDITVSGTNLQYVGMQNTANGGTQSVAESTVSLRETKRGFTINQASAMGVFTSTNTSTYSAASIAVSTGLSSDFSGKAGIGAGVTTLKGAMAVMDIAESAMNRLDKIRSDIGSVQNQLVATINNISVTQVNVKAAESQIRDVDFASESASFSKFNILAQAGSYAMSQANAVQQNVMRLLQ